MTQSPMSGRFCWYELMTTVPQAAKDFYTKVVGWKTQDWTEGDKPYTIWTAGEQRVGGLMELPEPARKMGVPPHWIGYVLTADVDAATAKATGLGATVHMPPTDIPKIGRFSIIADPTGAALALFKGMGDMNPISAEQPGEVSWHELITTDPDKAWSFYSGLFGWQKGEAMDMGPMGTYQLYGLGGVTLGGMMKKPAAMPGPSAWLYYVNVSNLKASIEAIQTGGGKVLNGPMQVPGGGWIAQGMDPQGAAFALFAKTA